MEGQKRPPLFLALQELKTARVALDTIIDLVESQQVDGAVSEYPPSERGTRIGEMVARMRKTSASVHLLCASIADHTDLPAAKKIVGRP